jgi:tetratricopeptide (TPR) repeat protein
MHERTQRQLFSLILLGLALVLLAPTSSRAAADDELRAAKLMENALQAAATRSPSVKVDAAQVEQLTKTYAGLTSKYPEHAGIRSAYAQHLWSIEQRAEAVAQWQKAAELDPHNADIAYRLGGFLVTVGRLRDADFQFQRAVSLAPDNALYHFDLGTTSFLFRNQIGGQEADAIARRALDHFRRATELEPFNLEYARGYAETFYAAPDADWKEALQAWQHFLEITPEKGFAYLHLARVSLRLGQKDQARGYLAKLEGSAFERPKRQLLRQIEERP